MMEERTDQIGLPWFDWEVIAECEYGVPAGTPEGVNNCGEPASYKFIWGYEGKDRVQLMNLCLEHFEIVKKSEEEDER